MIPKIIHYCWFGGNPKSKLIKKCINSWRKYCPDYKIIEWNETNFDLNCCDYVREAYEAKKWAFVTDYARLKIVYENGGIYLDTDVELIAKLDNFLIYDSFFGFEDDNYIATGLGFGAIASNKFVKAMLNDYSNLHFINSDGTYNQITCPKLNTVALNQLGLIRNGQTQILENNIFLPSDFFNPINYVTGEKKITHNTHSIHWFTASWQTDDEKYYSLILKKIYFIEKHFGKKGVKLFRLLLSVKELGLKNILLKLLNKIKKKRQ